MASSSRLQTSNLLTLEKAKKQEVSGKHLSTDGNDSRDADRS